MRHHLVLSLPMLALLAACDGESSSPNGTSATPAAQVAELGTAAYESADESLGAMLDEGTGGLLSVVNPSPCPLITTSFTNSPVPTATAVVQFGATPETLDAWPPAADDPCLMSRDRGMMRPAGMMDALEVYMYGRLEKTVTGTRDADLERSETLTDLGYVSTRSDFSDFHRAERDGTREFSRTASGVTASEALVTTRSRKLGETTVSSTATAALEWTFTPDAGSVIQPGTLRPDGTITVEGSWAFLGQVFVRQEDGGPVVQDVDVGFAVATVTPLVYDAGCPGRPRDRIASGQLAFTRTRGDQTVSFTLTWNGCGVAPVKEVA
ncbi:MAG TPA: hypothetical protein VFX50_05665 [Gemmatimonadales bacterium]|nr:hypothetical protein [Gemmatimonadales bacterium]